jgi:1-phosphofructokinase family hexose kinase
MYTMVLAAGLSPAWQHVLIVERLQPGAVNRAPESHWCASGKVINVGLALHYLSGGKPHSTLTLTPLGGPAYDAIDLEFDWLGAPRRWIRTKSPTRVCTTIVERTAGSSTELVENASPLTPKELDEFRAAFTEAASSSSALVITGSSPHGVPPTFYRDLLLPLDCPTVLDIRGPELLAALDAHPTLVKPNREELAATFGRPQQTDDPIRSAIAELQSRGAQAVLVTCGSDPAWLGAAGKFHRLPPEPVEEIVNPIGCGDCLAAGAAWALAEGRDLPTAATAGMSLAALNLKTLLPSDFDGRRARP